MADSSTAHLPVCLLRICQGRYKGRGRGAGCWLLGDMGDGLPKQSAAINDKLDQQCQRQRERNCHTQSERDPQDHGTVVKGEGECGV